MIGRLARLLGHGNGPILLSSFTLAVHIHLEADQILSYCPASTLQYLESSLKSRTYPLPSAMLLTETTTRRNAINKPAFPLPPELRLKVYELLLVHPDQSLKPNGFLHYEAGRPYLEKDYISTSILRACRSIYEEALPILYGKNNLTFHDNNFSKPLLPFPEGHLAMVKHIEVDISPIMYSSARKMGEFLATLGTSEAKLIDLSIHIHMLEESDELFRRSHNTLPPLPPLHLLDQFLVGSHPILGGLLSLKSVKKLYIQFEDEACFELGFTNVLKAALMKDGTVDDLSITIEKGCTFPHGELDEEYSWCLGCGNTMDDFENGTMNWEYKDDMLSRQALGHFLFQGGKLKKAKPAKANPTTGKAAKAKQPKTKAAATTSIATAKQTKAKSTKRSSKKVV